jgi:imidazole glycerol phosphate synthase glutamine amidotransferase subunit
MARVAVVDYGLANIRSVVNALECFEVELRVAQRGAELADADRIVLPGVGSFDAGMRGLAERGHVDALERHVREQGRPFLGICLGLQMLFEGSAEGSEPGLGWLPGTVRGFARGAGAPRVPHMGWNEVRAAGADEFMAGIGLPADFYFVHSYYVPAEGAAADHAVGLCRYDVEFVAAVRRDNIAAVQFHPEKSQLAGMKLLETFLDR